jgi:hypothetical protein
VYRSGWASAAVQHVLPEPANAVGEFIGDALTLAGEITSVVEGDNQGESALGKPVTLDPAGFEIEQRLAAAGAAIGHSCDMLFSDPAKLNAAYETLPWIDLPLQMNADGQGLPAAFGRASRTASTAPSQ